LQGYPGGALKHGPFALIEPGTPIILIIPNDENAALMRTAAEVNAQISLALPISHLALRKCEHEEHIPS